MKKMNAMAITESAVHTVSGEFEPPLHRTERRWTAALLVSGGLGALAGLGGLAIGALSLLGAIGSGTRLSTFGTWLVVGAFPLFLLAAHCLDKAADKAIRRDYCREHGLEDEEC